MSYVKHNSDGTIEGVDLCDIPADQPIWNKLDFEQAVENAPDEVFYGDID
jgi:hypothetical protein